MTGFRSAHIKSNEGFDIDKLRKCIEEEYDYPNVWEGRDQIDVSVSTRDNSPLKSCIVDQLGSIEKVAFGTGDDTGPGAGRVRFYDVSGNKLEEDGRSHDVPIAKDGLRIEHIR